ncbi:LysR family transcriptional regulator [Paraburkholderia sp. BL21I4N1]|uniref:LysR family transcriptional regulator n=1 Tax=Paraburkholderia sp. BL21I4N1 TaxID=1938801 RepID=UPI000CFD5A78|nr:LysR family transcriptional regulator [Paraburkholderia sp. BL21I4N1]PQV53040.1 DNA-binding transcriptional LysR family regulator [Paraburkholderia sp. BL21I4N1]
MKNLSQFLNFAAVARHGGFAHAARELSLAPSSVAKSIARLEQELGVRLFHRTTRSVHLTEEGQTLFAKCSRLLDEIDALDLRSVSAAAEPAGTLSIGAPIGYGTQIVLPALTALQRRYPALEFDLRLSDEQVNVVGEGLDAVIRFGALNDSSMIARQFDSQPLVLCASPAYLAAHPKIRAVADLAQHALVAFRMPTSGRERALEFVEKGHAVTIAPKSRFRISHGEALIGAAVQGAGLVQVPEFMARRHLDSGALDELLPQCRPAPLPVNVIVPGSRTRPARVDVLIDALMNSRLGAGYAVKA